MSLGHRLGAKLFDSGDLSEFTNREFHDRCDGKGPTIVIVAKQADGPASIIGGFASQSWDSHSGTKSAPGSFCFSLIRREREYEGVWYQGFMRYDKGSDVLLCSSERGPCFGDDENYRGLHINVPKPWMDKEDPLLSRTGLGSCGPCEGCYVIPRQGDDGDFRVQTCRILVFQALR
jgi:hypothetical protein